MSDLIPYPVTIQEVTTPDHPGVTIGEIANQYAAKRALQDYQNRLAKHTIRRHKTDLALFAQYLSKAGVPMTGEQLFTDIASWQIMTHGLVSGFMRYQEQAGYAIGSINVRLATIKSYCSVAAQAKELPADTNTLIKGVKGHNHKVGRNIDQSREVARIGNKKAEPVSISFEQAQQLKAQPDTPQGRRDTLLMCLLLDHGLRCGEVAALTVSSISISRGTLSFYREKVDKQQTHDLTRDTLIAAMRYFEVCKPGGNLFMGSRRGGSMSGNMSVRAITQRMTTLCQRIGIIGASAHDGRHAWATFAIRGGTDLKSLQDAGGWNSIVQPARYAESQKIANKGVVLGK